MKEIISAVIFWLLALLIEGTFQEIWINLGPLGVFITILLRAISIFSLFKFFL